MLSLSKTRRTREQFSPRCPVHPGRVPWAAEMRYPMEAPGRGCGRELDPIGQHRTSDGRLAQRESASFTPRRSLVRSQYRPPGQRLCESLYQAYGGSHSCSRGQLATASHSVRAIDPAPVRTTIVSLSGCSITGECSTTCSSAPPRRTPRSHSPSAPAWPAISATTPGRRRTPSCRDRLLGLPGHARRLRACWRRCAQGQMMARVARGRLICPSGHNRRHRG